MSRQPATNAEVIAAAQAELIHLEAQMYRVREHLAAAAGDPENPAHAFAIYRQVLTLGSLADTVHEAAITLKLRATRQSSIS